MIYGQYKQDTILHISEEKVPQPSIYLISGADIPKIAGTIPGLRLEGSN